MNKMQKFITIGTPLVLLTILGVFQNFAVIGINRHEVNYLSGTGIPLSEIVRASHYHQPAKRVAIPLPLRVEIRANEVAYIDKSIDVDELIINGQLHCDENYADQDIEIKAKVIYVNGVFQCGRAKSRYSKNLTLSLKHSSADPKTSVAYRGLVVNNGGKLILTGLSKNASYVKLAETAEPGQNYIKLDQPVDSLARNWSIGDEIVIAPTSYAPTEGETFKITAINGSEVSLSGNLLYRHWGQIQNLSGQRNGAKVLDQRAEVANLTRNILIRPDESTGLISSGSQVGAELGGHVMIMPGGQGYVDSVEFYKMGQAGMMARYPFHWHFVGNAPGQFIKNSSIHRSFQRCVTVHQTNFALVTKNVCYDFKGHGYFLEDGVETDNTLSYNLGINARFPHSNKLLLASDSSITNESSGRFPSVSVFWISHPKNSVYGNVAAGSVGSGFWMAFENEVKNSSGTVIARPIQENTKLFSNNVSHSAQVGFTWDGAPGWQSTGNPNNPHDRVLESVYYKPSVVPLFDGLVAYKHRMTGIYFRGYTAVYDHNITADNGWHYWLAYNQIVKNTVMVGRSDNFSDYDQNKALQNTRSSRYMQAGIVQYDGPFELNNVDFLKYPTQKLFPQNSSIEVTPIPVAIIGGTERLTNTSRKVSFNPDPIHRIFMLNGDTTASLGILGNSALRDQDGSFTNIPGAYIAGKDSMAVLPSSNCTDGGTKFYSHKICPPNFMEAGLHIFGGDNNPSPWNQPFLLRRSDGAISEPMQYWNWIMGINGYPRRGGTKVTLANSADVSYEMMIGGTVNPWLWIITEKMNHTIPVTKLVGYGSNCSLSNAQSVSSLAALKAATSSSYYSTGPELYFRLIPSKPYEFITANNPHTTATNFASHSSQLTCEGPHVPMIKGYVDGVRRKLSQSPVTIKGWSCDTTIDQHVNVELYVRSPKGTKGSVKLQEITANLTSEPAVAFECATPTTRGFRYEFSVPASVANLYLGQKIYVYGKSVTGGVNNALIGSGSFTIPKGLSFNADPAVNHTLSL